MTYKEWNAVIQVVSALVIGGWVVLDFAGGGAAGLGVVQVAQKLVWAIAAVIVFNIVAIIVVTILVSIARREEFKDEKDDERDRSVIDRSMRNGYVVTSIAGGLLLLALASGVDPVLAAYGIFAAPMLGGVTEALSRLVYYRVG
jgi:hypothetical protein